MDLRHSTGNWAYMLATNHLAVDDCIAQLCSELQLISEACKQMQAFASELMLYETIQQAELAADVNTTVGCAMWTPPHAVQHEVCHFLAVYVVFGRLQCVICLPVPLPRRVPWRACT